MQTIEKGRRVMVEGATGDRARFNGRRGRVREVRPRRLNPAATPFVMVVLDGRGNVRDLGYRTFWPRELGPAREIARKGD